MFASLHKKPLPFSASAAFQEELSHSPLTVKGKVPPWLSGTLVRNGPVTVTVDGKSNEHWFDGLAMLHAFSFKKGELLYSNRFLRTDSYRTVFEEGSLDYIGFAADPCRSLFRQFLTLLIPESRHPLQNANINVAKIADSYVAFTEIPLPVVFDPESLETLGVLDYSDKLPKGGSWESAHPHLDPSNNSTLNYFIKFGRRSSYSLYAIEQGSSERKLIAELPVDQPSYMHSFAMTENTLILAAYPLVVNPLDLLLLRKGFIKNYKWKPERGTRFIVVDRHTGELKGEWAARPFFAFHHVNAFEREGSLILDIIAYDDAAIITEGAFNVDGKEAVGKRFLPRLERFTLPLGGGEPSSHILFGEAAEFPRINSAYDGKPYRWAYLAGFEERVAEGKKVNDSICLYKVDTVTKQAMRWAERGCSPGEPVFVAAPGAKEEDEGVLLSVVLNPTRSNSFLLILDAKNFKELARAEAPHLIPEGLHGQYFEDLGLCPKP